MRVFAGLMIFLFAHVSVFAQKTLLPIADNSQAQKVVDSLNNISFHIYLGSPDSARALAEKALILSEKQKYQAGIGHSFINIGHVYWAQSYYPIALFYLNKALAVLPKDQYKLISMCYSIRGRVFADLNNYNEALKSLSSSELFAKNAPDLMAEVFNERALIYNRMGKYDIAIKNATRSLALGKIVHNDDNTAIIYARLSEIYKNINNNTVALAYSDSAYQASIAIKNNRLRAGIWVQYAEIYCQIHDYNRAISYAKKGVALADSIGVVDAIAEGYRTLIQSYEDQGDLKLAMFYQKKYNKVQDSLSAFNKKRNTELIQNYFILNKKLNDMAAAERSTLELKERMKWQKAVIFNLVLSLVVVVVTLMIIFYFYRQKRRLNVQLNQKNDALVAQNQLIEAQTANLETLNHVKDKLLAVIAHDLRSPLANLRNMVDMFEMDYLSKEELQGLMKDVNQMVKSAELTLSNLLEWAGSQIRGHNINLSQLDIFLLGVEMEQTFIHALQKKSIGFINKASTGKIVLADENHVKVVLRNLISNAIKFTDTNGHITLNAECIENKVIISVEDTGKGMTDEEIGKLFYIQTHFSQRGTQGENGAGIGLLLCKELVELNGGKLWISSSPGKGSTFYFSLPLNAEYV